MKTLVYGYGNPGRQDDGLGVYFVETLERWVQEKGLNDIEFDSNYQLNIEDALKVSTYDRIIFADAAARQDEPFMFREIHPKETIAFSTHAMAPESVLSLCEELYSKRPKTYLLTLRAEAFGINEKPTREADEHLKGALEFMMPLLENGGSK